MEIIANMGELHISHVYQTLFLKKDEAFFSERVIMQFQIIRRLDAMTVLSNFSLSSVHTFTEQIKEDIVSIVIIIIVYINQFLYSLMLLEVICCR